MSISGRTESAKINGVSISTFRRDEADLLMMYPSERWPTAYVLCPP